MDLFRYNSSGVPDYTDGRDGQTTFFSYNGGATISSLSFRTNSIRMVSKLMVVTPPISSNKTYLAPEIRAKLTHCHRPTSRLWKPSVGTRPPTDPL